MFNLLKKGSWFVLAFCLSDFSMADSFYYQRGTEWVQVPAFGLAVNAAYVDSDLSQYKRVLILEPSIEFQKGWQSEHRHASKTDMERISKRLAGVYRDVFTEVLTSAGYEVTDKPSDDVLGLRTEFTDLDVAAPDIHSYGSVRTIASSPGGLSFSSELFASTEDTVLARVSDQKQGRSTGRVYLGNSVSNNRQARYLMKYWAEMVVAELQGTSAIPL